MIAQGWRCHRVRVALLGVFVSCWVCRSAKKRFHSAGTVCTWIAVKRADRDACTSRRADAERDSHISTAYLHSDRVLLVGSHCVGLTVVQERNNTRGWVDTNLARSVTRLDPGNSPRFPNVNREKTAG